MDSEGRIGNQDQDVFENDMKLYLTLFCEENGIEDLKKESQGIWNACLIYIQKHVFPSARMFKIKETRPGFKSDYFKDNNCTAYDKKLLNSICDKYIYMCLSYDKVVSILGFSFLTGIKRDTILSWGDGRRRPTDEGVDIFKKLHEYREDALADKLISNKGNPVGILGVLNHFYGWDKQEMRRGEEVKSLGINDLPRLGTSELSKNDTQFTGMVEGGGD